MTDGTIRELLQYLRKRRREINKLIVNFEKLARLEPGPGAAKEATKAGEASRGRRIGNEIIGG